MRSFANHRYMLVRRRYETPNERAPIAGYSLRLLNKKSRSLTGSHPL